MWRLLLSADNICKLLGPDQARQNVGPDLDLNSLAQIYEIIAEK